MPGGRACREEAAAADANSKLQPKTLQSPAPHTHPHPGQILLPSLTHGSQRWGWEGAYDRPDKKNLIKICQGRVCQGIELCATRGRATAAAKQPHARFGLRSPDFPVSPWRPFPSTPALPARIRCSRRAVNAARPPLT